MREILGDDEDSDESESGSESGSESESESGSESEDEDDEKPKDDKVRLQIKDLTEEELTNFQKTVYLTMMSSMNPEEAVHKLLKLQPIDPERKELMLVDMIVKCCAQEKTYSKYYSLIGENLVGVNPRWAKAFDNVFAENYSKCHNFENALIRNIGSFWGHMFASDKMGWEVMKVVKLTETDSTSSGRIFLKFMFLKMQEELGLQKLTIRTEEDYIKPYLVGIFPDGSTGADDLRFSINFFTAIGLGRLTETMRDILTNLPPPSPVKKESDEESRGRTRERSGSGSGSSWFIFI
ncbi:unnamed protein product [Ambrosiozyma monospora]|uniref:Unnamed protein product n=1 Tax=Ambrosiozyma monospora TaxID=43982 RepID=A0ACB5TCE1_AMBMO|nr:unnamed protein product [Ambrosiozyma monospora]